jgi:ClpP class serine protease
MISTLFWLFFFGLLFLPYFRQKIQERQRSYFVNQIKKERGTKVITLVHQQGGLSFLGLGGNQYIDIDNAEQIAQIIRETPQNQGIDIILHTPGGLVLAVKQIVHALESHKGKITVFIPYYAMSGGTYVALAADKIVMDQNAMLGRIDPQIFGIPAFSIKHAIRQKRSRDIDDKMLILNDIAAKGIEQIQKDVSEILMRKGYTKNEIKNITTDLVSETYTHDYPVSFEEAKKLGLPVSDEMPMRVYNLMKLYPVQHPQLSA